MQLPFQTKDPNELSDVSKPITVLIDACRRTFKRFMKPGEFNVESAPISCHMSSFQSRGSGDTRTYTHVDSKTSRQSRWQG